MVEKWAMIDLETLGTGDMPVVLSIGIIIFDPWKDYREIPFEELNTLYLKPDIESCQEIGCSIDEATLEWWAQQDPAVIEETFSSENRISIRQSMKDLYRFCSGSDFYWGHGAIFDYGILEHVAKALERGVPWKYWQVRDSRTLFGLVDPQLPQMSKHHSLYDAYRQAVGVQNVFRALKISDYG